MLIANYERKRNMGISFQTCISTLLTLHKIATLKNPAIIWMAYINHIFICCPIFDFLILISCFPIRNVKYCSFFICLQRMIDN